MKSEQHVQWLRDTLAGVHAGGVTAPRVAQVAARLEEALLTAANTVDATVRDREHGRQETNCRDCERGDVIAVEHLHAQLYDVVYDFLEWPGRRLRVHGAAVQAFCNVILARLRDAVDRVRGVSAGRQRAYAIVQEWRVHRVVTEWLADVMRGADPANTALENKLQMMGVSDRTSLVVRGCKAFGVAFITTSDEDAAITSDALCDMVDDLRAHGGTGVSCIEDGQLWKEVIDMVGDVGRRCDNRDHRCIPPFALRQLLQLYSLAFLQIFTSTVQAQLVERARTFYVVAGNKWLATDGFVVSVDAYIDAVHAAYAAERGRWNVLLQSQPSACEDVTNGVARACHAALVVPHVAMFIDEPTSGFAARLRSAFSVMQTPAGAAAGASTADVVCMRRILETLREEVWRNVKDVYDTLVALVQSTVESAAKQSGLSSAHDLPSSSPVGCGDDVVHRWLFVADTAAVVQATVFQHDAGVARAVWRGMEIALNTSVDAASTGTTAVIDALVADVDAAVRGKVRGIKVSDMEAEARIHAALRLTQYIADKDAFREQYATALAKRLLTMKNLCLDTEAGAVSVLKALHGPWFARKLQDMLNDFRLAQDVSTVAATVSRLDGAALGGDDGHDSVEVAVLNLKAACWPMVPVPAGIVLPPAMDAIAARFRRHYDAHYAGRAMRWALGHGTAEVSVRFAAGVTRTVCCGTLQALVLLNFNDADGLSANQPQRTVKRLCDVTGMELTVMKSVLGSMMFVKDATVLRKHPATKSIEEGHVVEINDGFKPASLRVALPAVSLAAKGNVVETLAYERADAIDAAIVRIMKTRKVLAHGDLVLQVTETLRNFRPDTRRVKERIAAMMVEGYVARQDPASHSSPYVYVAATDSSIA